MGGFTTIARYTPFNPLSPQHGTDTHSGKAVAEEQMAGDAGHDAENGSATPNSSKSMTQPVNKNTPSPPRPTP